MKTKIMILICFLSLLFAFHSLYSQGFVWAQGYGSTGDDVVMSQVTDTQGNHYMAGYFSGPSIEFGNLTLTNSNGETFIPDLFIAKFDAEWNPVWAFSPDGDATAYGDIYNPVDIDVDLEGNCYLSGSFRIPEFEIGDITLYNTGADPDFDPFVARLNTVGQVEWAISFGGDYRDKARCISVDPSGGFIYIAGWFYSTSVNINGLIFENTDQTTNTSDVFLTRITSTGNILWATVAGGDNIDRVQDMDTDSEGNALLIGTYKGHNIQFGSQELVNTNAYFDDGFLVKYNPNGDATWSYHAGGQLDETIASLCIDNMDNVYLSGSFMSQTCIIGENELSNSVTSGEPSSDVFAARFNNKLNLIWVQKAGGDGNDVAGHINTDLNGNVYLTGGFDGEYFGLNDFTVQNSGSEFTSDIFMTKFNMFGNPEWLVKAGGSANDMGATISSDQSDEFFVTGLFETNLIMGSLILNSKGGSDFTFAKYTNSANLITGSVFLDSDKDGYRGDEESGIEGIVGVIQPGEHYFISDTIGMYSVYVEPGNYNIQLSPIDMYEINPPLNSANFNSYGLLDDDNIFGLQSIYDDTLQTEITLTVEEGLRKGQVSNSYLTVKNLGPDTISSMEIQLSKQDGWGFNSSYPSNIGETQDSIFWSTGEILPFDESCLTINTTVDTSFSKSSDKDLIIIICYPVRVKVIYRYYAGQYGYCYSSYWKTVIRCVVIIIPHDPNEILVSPSDSIAYTPSQVVNREPLEYTIRFQNTGNASCLNAVVLDTISDNLDLSTFEMLGTSHDCDVSISGRTLRWTFNNINLPDSTTDEPGSHGHIKYRITPREDLVIGDKIKSTAHIYFDYEVPVVTNTVCTVIGENLGVEENEEPSDNLFTNNTGKVKIAPNPFNRSARVILPETYNENVVFQLYNMTGQMVREIRSDNGNDILIDRESLVNGMYIYLVKNIDNTELDRGKLIIN